MGLAGDAITALAVDAVGTVWVGVEMDRMAQYGGLSRFDRREWRAYPDLLTIGTGPRYPAIRTIVPDGRWGVWLDTRHGVSHFDGQQWTHLAGEQSQPGGEVQALLVDTAGTVWVGTGRGLARFDGSAELAEVGTNWQIFRTDDGLAANEVRAVAVDGAGRAWFGTSNGLSVFDGTSWHTFTRADGLAADAISALAVDGAGRVWAGTAWWTTGGYVPEPAGEVTAIAAELPTSPYPVLASHLASNHVTAIAADGAGNVWVGTRESGLSVFTLTGTGDGSDFRTFTTEDRLVDDRIRAIAAGADGSLWVATAGGISHLRPALLPLAPPHRPADGHPSAGRRADPVAAHVHAPAHGHATAPHRADAVPTHSSAHHPR